VVPPAAKITLDPPKQILSVFEVLITIGAMTLTKTVCVELHDKLPDTFSPRTEYTEVLEGVIVNELVNTLPGVHV
jgi:hypothetical protein